MSQKQGLSPIINHRTKVLILGSFPSVTSLKERAYYAYRRNQFWRLISDVVCDDIVHADYVRRVRFLLSQGIGLWDVVKSCDRHASHDSHIKQFTVNTLERLISQHPHITRVFLNGRKAESLFKRYIKIDVPAEYLPSSSPALVMPYAEKVKKWQRIRKALKE